MIKKIEIETKTMPYGQYTSVREYDLMTSETLRELADDLSEDGLYSEAQWYRARARETGGKVKWESGSSSGDTGGFYSAMLSVPAHKALQRIVRGSIDKKRARVLSGHNGIFTFCYCAY